MRALLVALLMVTGLTVAANAAGENPPPRPVKTETIKLPGQIQDGDKAPAAAGESSPAEGQSANGDEPLPPVSTDLDALPAPVRQMREQILQAAKTGDISKLKVVIQTNELPPSLPPVDDVTDPVEILKAVSGDPEGREMLAIMSEVLEMGYAHTGIGTPQEMYVWPYLAAVPFKDLTPSQEVDLYRIITPGDREGMEVFGQYVFYRLGIGPDGVWHFFLTGE
ncbi:MAG: hypothetical protein H6883_01460 [Rhodobiaceae bacterium]|nr:hypothetical protein [Rhodobiaceae bacterium]MCC0054785.1 hypothetical protein [Rhodobiaceae bacterium]